jgi:NAD(P)H-flavin reductase
VKAALEWQLATVTGIREETARVKTFTLALPAALPHLAGQHYDLRLTAEDGYQAQRSYSIASDPTHPREVELTIERLADGEVSTFMHDVVVTGDRVEVRGPIVGRGARRADPLDRRWFGHRAADGHGAPPSRDGFARARDPSLQLAQP